MRLLITGSRGWGDKDTIRTLLQDLREVHDDLIVIHGDAPKGADRLADQVCIELGIPVIREPADWNRHGKAAGPIRNRLMLTKHKPDRVLAFRAAGKSNGTDDMIAIASEAQVHVVTVHAHVDA